MAEVSLSDLALWPAEDSADGVEARWRLVADALTRLGFRGHDANPDVWDATTLSVAALDRLAGAVEDEAARERLDYVVLPGGRQRRWRRLHRARTRNQVVAKIDRIADAYADT